MTTGTFYNTKPKAWQKLLLNIINVKALCLQEGQHKRHPLHSIYVLFLYTSVCDSQGLSARNSEQGIIFFSPSLLFSHLNKPPDCAFGNQQLSL